MQVLLVINPRSGTADAVDPASLLAEHGCSVREVAISEASRWNRDDSARPDLSAIERVVVAGGDGSVGCAARLAQKLGVPLGVVPAGTANDFARAMELSDDPAAACVVAGTGQRLRAVDLALVDGMPFVNVASIGIAPDAAEGAKRFKSGLGALAYPIGAAVAAVKTRPVSVVARVDGELVWSGRAWQAMVASTGAFGGWAETGKVRHGDGMLDLVIVPAGRGTRTLAVDAAALMKGELAHREGVHHFRGARIELVLHRAPRMVVDGEIIDVDDRHVVAVAEPPAVQVVVG